MVHVNGLGEYLRARRAQVKPADVGLPAGLGLRRTPGLRREELAALSGVSIDYYTRLEQGKETNPSSAVLDALAAALLLNNESQAHLYALANHARRDTSLPTTRSAPPPVDAGLLLLIETLRPSPAYLLSRTSDVLASNPEALALFAGLRDWPEPRRNTIRYVFLHPAARELFDDWDHAAQVGVANLQGLRAHDPDAPSLAALVEELSAASPEFARLWNRYDVHIRRGGTKTFHHPGVGGLTLQHQVLWLSGGDQRLSIYLAPPGSPDHDALALLAMTTRAAAP